MMINCGTWVQCLQWVVYVPVVALGLPLNGAALWLLLFRVRRWSESTVYLSSLVINDSLLILSLPFKMRAYDAEWTLGHTFCWLLEAVVYVNVYGSILLSVCIAIDRYLALCYPFATGRLRSPRKAALVCAGVWALLFGCSYPVHSIHSNTGANGSCFQNFSTKTWGKWWIVASMETIFCSCATIMIFCSVEVVRILRRLRRHNPFDAKLRNNKSVKIVLSNLLVFLACFVPYHVAAPLYFSLKAQAQQAQQAQQQEQLKSMRQLVHASLCLSSVNCLADGACYYFILKENLQTLWREGRSHIQKLETHTQAPETQALKSNGLNENTSHMQTTQR